MSSASEPALNETLLPGNTCYGCSPTNPDGLQLRIYREDDRDDLLVGTYSPRATHGGFPSITHGGLQYTALDCMAGWIVFGSRSKERQIMPLTQSAQVTYKRPATLNQELRLRSELLEAKEKQGRSGTQMLLNIRTELFNVGGELLTQVDFLYVGLPIDTFCKAVGLTELPETYRIHYGL